MAALLPEEARNRVDREPSAQPDRGASVGEGNITNAGWSGGTFEPGATACKLYRQ